MPTVFAWAVSAGSAAIRSGARSTRSPRRRVSRLEAFEPIGALLAYLVLMWCTGIVPMNMFSARILGFTDPQATETAIDQFRPQRATQDPWQGGSSPSAYAARRHDMLGLCRDKVLRDRIRARIRRDICGVGQKYKDWSC